MQDQAAAGRIEEMSCTGLPVAESEVVAEVVELAAAVEGRVKLVDTGLTLNEGYDRNLSVDVPVIDREKDIQKGKMDSTLSLVLTYFMTVVQYCQTPFESSWPPLPKF